MEIKNLKVAIENNMILNELNLKIQKGEIHAIMGPNGSGKSTFSKVVAGHPAYSILEGDILFKGNSIIELSPEERSLFKKYGVAPCDCSKADQQDHLFSLEISGTIYPKIENATDLKPLSHPYKVRIMYYDNQSGYIKMSRREKLSAIPLLPLTIAIDIIQLPLKALDITYQP